MRRRVLYHPPFIPFTPLGRDLVIFSSSLSDLKARSFGIYCYDVRLFPT